MIKIDFYTNGFVVKNHANFKEYGYDIVCAGVSAIIMGSLTWFDKNEIIECIVDENIPMIKLIIQENRKNILAITLISNQINEIYKSYEKYINFNKHNLKL